MYVLFVVYCMYFNYLYNELSNILIIGFINRCKNHYTSDGSTVQHQMQFIHPFTHGNRLLKKD